MVCSFCQRYMFEHQEDKTVKCYFNENGKADMEDDHNNCWGFKYLLTKTAYKTQAGLGGCGGDYFHHVIPVPNMGMLVLKAQGNRVMFPMIVGNEFVRGVRQGDFDFVLDSYRRLEELTRH
jgi:hypothetical protein